MRKSKKSKNHAVNVKDITYDNLRIRQKIILDSEDAKPSMDSLVRIAMRDKGWWVKARDLEAKKKELGLDVEIE